MDKDCVLVEDVNTQEQALHPEALLFKVGESIQVSDGLAQKNRVIKKISKFSPRSQFFALIDDKPANSILVDSLLRSAKISPKLMVHLSADYPNLGIISFV